MITSEQVKSATTVRHLQDTVEMAWWLNQLIPLSPETGLEIGHFCGGSSAIMLALTPSLRRIIAVDVRRTSLQDDRVTFICGDSRTKETKDKILGATTAPVDFAFIDGGHEWNAVSDLMLCLAIVRAGGLVGLHDTGGRENDRWPGPSIIWKLIRCLGLDYGSVWNGCGIGVIKNTEEIQKHSSTMLIDCG